MTKTALSYGRVEATAAVKAACTAIVVVSICMPLAGQIQSGGSDPKRLIVRADRLAWLYNWFLAGPIYAEAERQFQAVGDSRNALYAKIGRLRSEWETMSFPEVSEYLTSELDTPLAQQDLKLRLWILDAKGALDLEVNVAAARADYEEAREIARKLGDRAREARASGELGVISFLEGGAGDSITLLGDALKTSMELRDIGAHIRYLNLFGNGLNLFGRPEDAIRYFDRALQLVRNTPDLDTSVMAVTGKAQALIALNKRAEAEKLLRDNLKRARLRKHNGWVALTLMELAKIAHAAGERDTAVSEYQEAATLAKSSELHRLVAIAMFELAGLYRKAGDLEQAEHTAAEGLAASRKVGEMYEMPQRIALLAALRSDRGQFHEADRLYEDAEDIVDGLLVSVGSAAARTSLVGVMSQIYVDHFALVVSSLNNPKRALEVLERARGRTAADVLKSRELTTHSTDRARSAIDREIARLQIRLMGATTKPERREILDRLFDVEQGLAGSSRHQIPRTLAHRSPVDLETLQTSLRDDETVLEFALAGSDTHCLVIDNREVRVLKLADSRRIEAAVDDYLSQVRARGTASQAAKSLYSLLLAPVPSDLLKPRLIIVPDGKLHLLPFDALVDRRGAYVLAKHVITYAPSATVHYLLKTQRGGTTAAVPLLAVGDVPYSGAGNLITAPERRVPTRVAPKTRRGLYDLTGEKLLPLPGAADEVRAVAAIAGPRSIVLTGANATEARFRSERLDNVMAIHLAVHGISSVSEPDRAALVLGRHADDGHDGLLQAREIAEMNLPAELVTLSACDTGAGRLVGQEGMVNLVRSFIFAGSRSVVASLWSADDAFTTTLMKRFYTNLVSGMDRSAALQRAKLSLIEQFGDDAVPFLWAAFTMSGEGSRPIKFTE